MPDVILNPSNVSKMDYISSLVLKELQFQAQLLPKVTDVSQFAVKGVKTISFPKLSSFTAVNRAFGSAGNATVISETVDTLTIDKTPYVAYLVDESSAMQSSIDWALESSKRGATALARFVDNEIISTIFGAGIPVTAAGDITYDSVLEMIEELRKSEADMNQVTLLVSPAQHTALMKLDEYKRADVFGAANLQANVLGYIHGIPVQVHSGLSDAQFAMFEKSAVAIGFQAQVNMSEQGANEIGAMSKRVAMDAQFGLTALQLGEKGAGATESPLIRINN
jgi:hypothetical protein